MHASVQQMRSLMGAYHLAAHEFVICSQVAELAVGEAFAIEGAEASDDTIGRAKNRTNRQGPAARCMAEENKIQTPSKLEVEPTERAAAGAL